MVLTRHKRAANSDSFESLPYKRQATARKASAAKARAAVNKITRDASLPQDQSPLFSVLCPELRQMIFKYALSPNITTNDVGNLSHGTTTSLLRTCRLIFLETRWLPIQNSRNRISIVPPGRAGPFSFFSLSPGTPLGIY
jgi:hypothetical protein